MYEKLKGENLFSKIHLIFLMIVYCMFEIMLYYLFPCKLSYRYLRLTGVGIFCIVSCILPIVFGIHMLIFYSNRKIGIKIAIISFLIIIGIISPMFGTLYATTLSETRNLKNYLKMDLLPEKDERDIKDFFPKSVPDDVEKIKYHYKFSEEGMNKGLQISLLINFNEEEEYLI